MTSTTEEPVRADSKVPPQIARRLPAQVIENCPFIRITSQAKYTKLVSTTLSHLVDSAVSDAGKSPEEKVVLLYSHSVETLPKLVSIAEIIKREWEKVPIPINLNTAVEESARRRERLKQWNLLGAVEEGSEPEEKDQDAVIEEWLDGKAGKKKRPRKKHTPFMIVAFSFKDVPSLQKSGFTYQAPPPIKSNKRKSLGDGDDRKKKKRRRKTKPRNEEAVQAPREQETVSQVDVSGTATAES